MPITPFVRLKAHWRGPKFGLSPTDAGKRRNATFWASIAMRRAILSGEDPPKHDNRSKDNLMYEDQPYGAFLPKDRILRWFPNLDE
jgi:hypothetical protein